MALIRPARAEDLPLLPAIEIEADRLYATVGLDVVLGMQPASLARLRQGPVWVARDAADRSIGFALAGVLDGQGFLDQLSVLPAHGRRGVGAALLAAVLSWATAQGFPALLLTTYRDPPWNAPFYAKHGFAPLPPEHWSRGVRELVARETALGHPPERRTVMRRELR